MYNLNNKLNEQQRLNIICSKLVNKLMKDGKKTISEKIVMILLEIWKKHTM